MRTTRGRIAVCLALAMCLGPLAGAQEPPPPGQPVIELTLDEAVARALENNVDIAVQRYDPESSAQDVREAEGAYDPFFFSTLTKTSSKSPSENAFAGADTVETDTSLFNFGINTLLKTGGTFRVDFNNQKQDTNSAFTDFNPIFRSNLNFRLIQPLLRDLGIDPARQQLRLAKKNKEISDVQFSETVKNTIANVKNLYYDLLYAMDNLEAQRKSLSLAQKLLNENQIKVRVGTMAPLDVVAAESEVASREEGVIVADAAVAEAEDQLRRSILPVNDAETWRYRIVPKDRPTYEAVVVNVEAAIQRALEGRTDVVALRKTVESAQINVDAARNSRLPVVDLVAAYGSTGTGGTELIRDPPFGGPVVDTIPGGYGDATSQVFGNDFPTWTLGFSVSYPILNRQARAQAARAQVARDQAEANLRRLEVLVTAEVRSSARAVDTNMKRVGSTRAARVLQERRLDAEEKKFAAGMSTNFLVTQAQRDLALAEVLELLAVADYRKSLVNFERVQEAGAAGLTSAAISTGTAAANRAAGRTTTQSTVTPGQQF
jgi:outer membrane protein TolC